MQYTPTIVFVVKVGVFVVAVVADIGVCVVASADVNDIFAIVVDELLVSVMKTLELSARQAL